MPRIKILKPDLKNKNLLEICSSQAKDALKRNNYYLWVPEAFNDLKDFLRLKEINKIDYRKTIQMKMIEMRDNRGRRMND